MSNPNNAQVNCITKESLSFAAAKCLENTAFSNITISSLCEVAGVSRKAYYRNFDSLETVLKYYLFIRWTRFAEEKRITKLPQKDQLIYLIPFIYSEQNFIRSIRNNDLLHILEELFMEVFISQEISGAERYFGYVVVYTIYAFIRAMVDNDFSETPEQMETMFSNFSDNIDHIMKL